MNAPQAPHVLDDRTPMRPGPAEERIGDLVREHRSVLLAHAVQLTAGDRAWAEDVVQEAFIRAWRRIDRMTGEYGSVRSWLMRVTHNLVIDGYRARRARPVEIEETYLPDRLVNDASDHVLSAVIVDEALATLSTRHRVALEETLLRDRTVKDAARELELPVGTVKSRVFYALRQLREGMAVVRVTREH